MKTKVTFINALLLFVGFSFFSCSKEEIIPADVEANNFVWGGMNAYYKWQGEVEDLADTNFSNRDQLNNYLAGFETPDNLFNSLLYRVADDASFITDDYTIIENAFDGVKYTTGMKLNGMNYNNSNDFYVYVYDVIEGSNADLLGVTRGMIITEINGTEITLNNIDGLLDSDNISISLANYNGGNPVSNGAVINLSKSEIQENPIKIQGIVEGTDIGYLMYNNFTPSYDDELNSVFANLRANGITNLIVDLRYNGGGSIESASYLASMITGQFEDEVFSKQIWNDKVMTNVLNQNLTNFFTDEIDNGIVNQSISSLGLSTVYFIVSDATAGPAEILINSLQQYDVDVKLIGMQTKGITEASLTIYDSDDYTKNGENFSTSHTWAMQSIVLEVQNSNNSTASTGIAVDFEFLENAGNLGVLGQISDPVLSATIEYVSTESMNISAEEATVITQNLWNSSMQFIDFNKMYVNLK